MAVLSPESTAEREAPAHSRFPPALVLAVPYLAAIAALRGLTAALPIFHGTDERVYHLPLIHRFSQQLPFPDLVHYHAAQTPLFHLLMAYVGKVIGYEVWRLRLLEALISYLAALVLYALLVRRRALRQQTALLLSLLFALSPYVYGTSFRVMTDNLALLLVIVALERFEAYRKSARLAPFVVGAISVTASVLTRQSMAFMYGVAVLYALIAPLRTRSAAANVARAAPVLAIAAAPVAALFAVWHGLVPRGGDPASCGLCSPVSGTAVSAQGHLVVQSTELALATAGLYGAILFAPQALLATRRWRGRSLRGRPSIRLIAAAVVGLILLLLFAARPGLYDAGYLWRIAARLPQLDGSSILFWALVPLGCVVLYLRLRLRPLNFLALAFFACFLASTLVYRLALQKYVDPFVVLGLLLTVRRSDYEHRESYLGAGILMVGFIAYTLSFVI
ncbi:MAG: glycosyltransferase family 39 protein [Solirubrobacterales bacterium]|nr:glycosyltransferase family 39 protein [Solirubrobacterales bacterium]